MTKETEFRAYAWIDARLKAQAWDTRNPNKTTAGQVWNQHEASADPEIKKALANQKPESICRVSPTDLWIIEAKQGLPAMAKAVEEAKGYCEDINAGSQIVSARIATGVAGEEANGYVASSWLLVNGEWHEVFEGDEPCRRLLTQKECRRLLHRGNAQIVPAHLTVNEAVRLSGRINTILHSSKIEKERRALIVSFLILALHQDQTLKYGSSAKVFLDDINSRASWPFLEMGRQSMWESIKISYSEEDLTAKAKGLSEVLEILKEAEVSSLAQEQDILGNFFESFLKYGNTSKELGIVLTPRHICKLAADCVGITSEDVVLDIAAGTGGFLVAAYNRIKAQKTISVARDFAKNNIYGCEDSGSVAALAFINMYLRGDGKHNLKADSCFNWDLQIAHDKPAFVTRAIGPNDAPGATKVLMNPPFSLKTNVQSETDFIDHGLRQLEPNGVLFAIVPSSVFYDRSTRDWRTALLNRHSLLSVVAFPKDLFYPVATETVGVFIKGWVPHPAGSDVLWTRVADDGFEKKKRFRVEKWKGASAAALGPVSKALQSWIVNGVQVAEQRGVLEFLPLIGDEFVPHVHLGPAAMTDAELSANSLSVIRNMLVESWGRPNE